MLKKYKVQFNKHYIKELEKIPKKDREQIRSAVLQLSTNPRPAGCEKLKGLEDVLYRIRCGNYRVVYTIHDDILLVLVIEVGHRKNIYREL